MSRQMATYTSDTHNTRNKKNYYIWTNGTLFIHLLFGCDKHEKYGGDGIKSSLNDVSLCVLNTVL